MRCARHPRPPGSVGVCPSCLRERLLYVIEAQAGEDRRKSDVLPPPLIFPRSVSPYTCRRSDASHQYSHFYSTPQIGPTFKKEELPRKEKKSRFSLISYLFGFSRSEEIDRDPRVSAAPIAGPSWFSAFRKKKSRLFSLDDEIHGGRRSHPARDRGMSPEKEEEEEQEREDGYATGQWYSCESSPGWRKSVSDAAGPAPTRRCSQHARNVSGFAFCLSPLVRASPNRRNRVESGFSAELRRANRQHLSTAASLCVNRSRKLADFGRYP